MAERKWGRVAARSLPRAAAVLAGAALVAGSALAPAQAETRHWRVFAGTGRAILQDVAVSGPHDAWAAGFRCLGSGFCGGSGLVVEHWNGHAWRAVPGPRGVPAGSVRVTVGGKSARDAWLFANDMTRAKAFHWNGRTWTAFSLPGASAVNSVDVFGRRDAWVFGFAGQRDYAARFNGRTWRRVSLPGSVYYQEAVSASDIWAVGPTAATQSLSPARQVYVAMRWNGHRWRTVALPRLRLRPGRYLAVYGLAATGRRDLWLDYSTANGSSQGAGLLRWNGRWRTIAVPYSAHTYAVQRLTPDGRGGVWLAALGNGRPLTQYLYHFRKGRWSRQVAPGGRHEAIGLQDIAWSPGTASVWAVGIVQRSGARSGGWQGVFLRFGD